MAKYVIDGETLDGLADAIRSVTGSTRKFTPQEMIEEVKDILNATTFILVDKDGNEYPAVYVDSDVVITATPNDIRKGTTAITAEGVIEGEKEIPNYRAQEGVIIIDPEMPLEIAMFSDMYQYDTLQSILCAHANSICDSVSAEKVVIDSKLYNVATTNVLADVTLEDDTQTIRFGLVNDKDYPLVIRYMIIKEDTK